MHTAICDILIAEVIMKLGLILIPSHMLIDFAEQDAAALIAEAMHEAEDDSKKKFYTHRVDKARQERKDTGSAMVEAEAAFAENKTVYAYGKKVAGLLKAKLQQKFGRNIDIYKPTEQVSDRQFTDIHSAA